MIAAILAVSLLAGTSGGSATPAAPASSPAKAPPASFEVIVTEPVLAGLLAAAAPFETASEQEVAVMGFSKTITVNVKLTDPVVKIAKDGIHVTMNYQAHDASGFVNAAGVANPELQIVAVPSKNIFEGRMVRATITLPGGLELEVNELVDPIEIPAVFPEEIDLGDGRRVTATAHGTDVLLEDGKIHLKGFVDYKKTAAPPSPAADKK